MSFGLRLFFLNELDDFFQLFNADLFILHELAHYVAIGVVEVVSDIARKPLLLVFLATHLGKITKCSPEGFMANVAFLLQCAHHGGKRVDMGLGLIVEFLQFLYEHGSVFPVVVHDFFFAFGQFLHGEVYGIKVLSFFAAKLTIKYQSANYFF